jgi:transcription elongation factor S-II
MYKIKEASSFREKIRGKIQLLLDDSTKSANLEKGIFNYTIKEASNKKIVKKWENPCFSQLYVDHLRSIFFNLKNEHLLNQVKTGEISPQILAFMTHQEFDPEKWQILLEKKMKRDNSKFTNNIESSTSMFKCKRCKSEKCTYYELQTRSADEPSTIFVTCLDCGKRWKT